MVEVMANRGGATPEVRFRAAERERQIIALRVRGIPFELALIFLTRSLGRIRPWRERVDHE
jgi:hypothetical protein